MAESTLAVDWDLIRKRVGFHRGYGTDKDEWSESQAEQVEMCVDSGIRLFLNPAVNPPHEWSFLKQDGELTIPSGGTVVPLPADFGQLIGNELFFVSSSVSYPSGIRLTNIGKIRLMQQKEPSAVGLPQYAAVRPADNTPSVTSGQRYEMVFFPETDAAYTVRFQYTILGDRLAQNTPHPPGGAAHAETLIEACLVASEQSVDGQQGIHGGLFQRCLKASIDYDRRMGPSVVQRNQNDLYRPSFIATHNGLYSE